MDWIIGMQKAIDYIENHLTEKIDYDMIAAQNFSSSYHFQRVFSILCGFTIGEYIRNRRLSLAGSELATTDAKVIDVALKYGYESPDSFAKAFKQFHGVLPSQVKNNGSILKSFAPLVLKISLEGGSAMKYRIEEKPEMILTGYKARFTGVPYGEEREKQEGQLFVSTRAKQWLLRGAKGSSSDTTTDMCLITNIDDEGYDFYYVAELDKYERDNMYNKEVTGFNYMHEFGFENIVVPKQTYAIFTTEEQAYPVSDYMDIRKRIVSEWLPANSYEIKDAPEISVYHWFPKCAKEKRYIEIWLPIEKAER